MLFVETVPDDYATQPHFTCTSGGAAPGLDITDAITGALGGLIALGLVNSLPGVSDSQKTWIPVAFLAPAAGLTVSGIYGIVKIEECQHAKAETATRAMPTVAPTVCSYDTECSGDQICIAHQCGAPHPVASPSSAP